MTWRHYFLLAVLGLIVVTVVAAFQSTPGYMDADYYYAGGLQLANGHGFTEPYLWNYLDNPTGLPHPSNAYWMPLASLLAAAGSALFGPASWLAARIGFLVVAAIVPPLTAALAWSFTSRRDLALVSGLLGVFSAFYLPFLPVTDTFGLYMVLGGLFFLLLSRTSSLFARISLPLISILLGVIAGLMHFTRADGLLWLLLAFMAIFLDRGDSVFSPKRFKVYAWRTALILTGYLLIMGPWFVRNYFAFGAPLGPGGAKMLWLTAYDQLFAYPPSQLTFAAWWQSGIASIMKARAWALGINLERTLAEQGEIFLLPLIGLGLWHLRHNLAVKMAGIAWLLTLAAMTLAFPYAGARGGFFHSGAALQPVWWALAPVGLDRVIAWGKRRRGWDAAQAGMVFRPALVGLAVLLSAGLVWGKVIGMDSTKASQTVFSPGAGVPQPGYLWSQENTAYRQIDSYLIELGASHDDVIMVANPPGFYLASGNSTLAVPDGDIHTLMEVARLYGATYLILEKGSMPVRLFAIYDHLEAQPELVYKGEVAGARIFLVDDH